MSKGRIGLSLDDDVLAILNKYGRDEKRKVCRPCLGTGKDRSYDDSATAPECPACLGTMLVLDPRPTRTQIIEEAVREWSARQDERTPGLTQARKARGPRWSCCGRYEDEHKVGIDSTVCPTAVDIRYA